jgi:hypothetical protein
MNSTAHESLSTAAVPIPPEPVEHLAGKELIGYDIAKDGTRFCMSFACVNGKKGSLSFPTESLKSLIMTLMLESELLYRVKSALPEWRLLDSSQPTQP